MCVRLSFGLDLGKVEALTSFFLKKKAYFEKNSNIFTYFLHIYVISLKIYYHKKLLDLLYFPFVAQDIIALAVWGNILVAFKTKDFDSIISAFIWSTVKKLALSNLMRGNKKGQQCQ